jgi:hypothetical protein
MVINEAVKKRIEFELANDYRAISSMSCDNCEYICYEDFEASEKQLRATCEEMVDKGLEDCTVENPAKNVCNKWVHCGYSEWT